MQKKESRVRTQNVAFVKYADGEVDHVSSFKHEINYSWNSSISIIN